MGKNTQCFISDSTSKKDGGKQEESGSTGFNVGNH